MRILLVTQYFDPENFKSNDIAYELAKRGHEVDALVGIPNYPEGKYYKGYGLFKKRKETKNGVNIYRCFQSPRGKKASSIGLSINYITFVISATLWVLFFFSWRKKYDVIVSHEPSPITQVIPAIIMSKIRRVPVYTWILDIWPDSAMAAFRDNKGKLIKFILTWITEWVYKNSKLLLVSSKGMKTLVNRNHDYTDKLVYFPNWCDDIKSLPMVKTIDLPKKFVIMMAGNLNTGIGWKTVIDLVDNMKDVHEVLFVFVGGGTKEKEMREVFAQKGLNNVIMTGRLPFEQMPALYSQASAMLLTLRKTNQQHLKSTVPARLQSYMAAGKPILAMIDGCSQDIINRVDCGFAVDAGDFKRLSDYIRNVILKDQSIFVRKGELARSFYESYYQKENCISNLEYYLRGVGFDNPPFPAPNV